MQVADPEDDGEGGGGGSSCEFELRLILPRPSHSAASCDQKVNMVDGCCLNLNDFPIFVISVGGLLTVIKTAKCGLVEKEFDKRGSTVWGMASC